MTDLIFSIEDIFKDGIHVFIYKINNMPVPEKTYFKLLKEYADKLEEEVEYESCDCIDCQGECDCEDEEKSWDDGFYDDYDELALDKNNEDLCPTCRSYLAFADGVMMCETAKEVLDLVSDFADFHFQNGRMSAFGEISDVTAELHDELMDSQLERSEEVDDLE